MSYNIYCVGLDSESTLPRKKNPKFSMHPHWKGEPRKPREVKIISPDYNRSRGVRAYYCKVVNGKVVNVER